MQTKTTKWEKIYQNLRESILKGEFIDGQKIGVEQELSDKFKVSRVTVQKALTALVSEGLAEHRPNSGCFVHIAKNKKISSKSIGIVVHHRKFLSQYLLTQVISGVEQIISKADRDTKLIFLKEREFDEAYHPEYAIRLINQGRVAGLLLLAEEIDDRYMEEVAKTGIKFVWGGYHRVSSRRPQVRVDVEEGVKQAAEYLIRKGRRQIGLILGPLVHPANQEKANGLWKGLANMGLPSSNGYIAECFYDKETTIQALEQLFAKLPNLNGIITTDDYVAGFVINELKAKGIKVPDDIAVIGFGNLDASTIIEPNLTTMDVHATDLGRISAETLLRLIDDREQTDGIPHIKIVPTLTIRQSA